MPYYLELSPTTMATTLNRVGAGVQVTKTVARSTKVSMGYRSRYPSAPWSLELTPLEADPYAGFLSGIQKVRSHDRVFIPDTGHPFVCIEHEAYPSNERFSVYTTKGVHLGSQDNYLVKWSPYSGPYALNAQLLPYWSSSDLPAFGQNAIAKVAPTPHVFEMSQFLGELREGLPSLVGAALLKGRVRDIMRNAGSEYLNVQFGWVPLVSDLRKLVDTVVNLDSVLSSQRGAQGQPQRARFKMPQQVAAQTDLLNNITVSTDTGSVFNGGSGSDPVWGGLPRFPQLYSSIGFPAYDPSTMSANVRLTGTSIRTAKLDRWFEGSFTSYFDYPPADASWLAKASSLMNLKLTPEVLWELAPWSWLVDWVFHIQSSIESNSIAGDKQVVMNYGYVMERNSVTVLVNGQLGPRYGTYVVTGGKVAQLIKATYFRRVRANPFGFTATSFQGLNPGQVAILTALGMSQR